MMKRLLQPEFTYLLALIPAVFTKSILNFGLNVGLPWTVLSILIWILILLLAAITAIHAFKILQGHSKFWVPILAFTIPLGSYFAANPIYEGDYNKLGTSKDIAENDILKDILGFKSDFNGLVCVASPHCPYCLEAVREKVQMLHKRNKIDVLVYMAFGDEKTIQDFRMRAESPNVPIIVNSNPNSGLDIDESVIPVFLFIKDSKIVYLWRNDQLGFPALDWIERGLK
jgi:hypothetical protein